MQNYKEYQLSKQVAFYLRMQYPNIIYHFDLTGANLSKAQAGKMKTIQGVRGFPDLIIYEPKGMYHGLAIELKAEGTKLYKKNSDPATPHISEQLECLVDLKLKGYMSGFAVGFDECVKIIDNYLKQ